MTTLAGKTLGKYRVVERLGRGGMADVYKAYHPRLDRFVAIKVLHAYLAEGEKDFLARFEREARAVAALQHPNIVQVYDFDVEADVYYMVMEYVEGGSLKGRLAQTAQAGQVLPLAEVGRLFRQIAAALDYAHRQGMLHRDVKPANVLLDKTGRVVLSDFGIARIVGDSQYTTTGALIGTPAYMSPEQGRGERATAASDVYSLGIVLYELIVGRAPFDADTPLGVIHKHIHEPLPLPRQYRPDLPEALERVVLKALAKEPGDRYQSVGEMLQAFNMSLAAASELETTADETPGPATEIEMPAIFSEAEGLPPGAEAPTIHEPAPPLAGDSRVAASAVAPTPASASSPWRIWLLIAILAVGGLVVAGAALLVAVPILFRGETITPTAEAPAAEACATLEECTAQAQTFLDEQDFAGAVERFDLALRLAAEGEHPPWAHLWCERGHANLELDRADEAAADFEHCIAWTEEDPDLQPVRDEAIEMLRELRPKPETGIAEPFDDPSLPGWEHPPAVSVEGGVLRMEPGGFLARPLEWSEAVQNLHLFTRLRVHAAHPEEVQPRLAVSYHTSDAGSYRVVIGDEFLALERESHGRVLHLADPVPISPDFWRERAAADGWFTLQVTVLGGEHAVAIEGERMITAVDPDPLPLGGIAFEVVGDTVVEIDEVVLERG